MKKEQLLIVTHGDLNKYFSAGWSVAQISAKDNACFVLLEREKPEQETKQVDEIEHGIKPPVRIEFDEEKALMSITNSEGEKYGRLF